MHPIVEEIARCCEKLCAVAGIQMSDMMFLTRAEAQALVKQCDIEATFLDDSKVEALLDNDPRLLGAYVSIKLTAERGKP